MTRGEYEAALWCSAFYAATTTERGLGVSETIRQLVAKRFPGDADEETDEETDDDEPDDDELSEARSEIERQQSENEALARRLNEFRDGVHAALGAPENVGWTDARLIALAKASRGAIVSTSTALRWMCVSPDRDAANLAQWGPQVAAKIVEVFAQLSALVLPHVAATGDPELGEADRIDSYRAAAILRSIANALRRVPASVIPEETGREVCVMAAAEATRDREHRELAAWKVEMLRIAGVRPGASPTEVARALRPPDPVPG